MAKAIAVSDDVYELLKRSKAPGESFSKVIKRNFKKIPSLLDVAGSKILTKEDWKEIDRHLKKAQKKTALRLLGS